MRKLNIKKMLGVAILSLFLISISFVGTAFALTEVNKDGGRLYYGNEDAHCHSNYWHPDKRHFSNVFNKNGDTPGRQYANAQVTSYASVPNANDTSLTSCQYFYGF